MSVFDDWRYPCTNCPKKDCKVGCAEWREWICCLWNEVCLPFRKAVNNAPAADMVSREVFDQVKWERDIAMQQLEEHGIPFGERKD